MDLIAAVSNWVEHLLQYQKKTDYKPKDDFKATTTAVCDSVCEFLDRVRTEIGMYLEDENHDQYLSELGTKVFR